MHNRASKVLLIIGILLGSASCSPKVPASIAPTLTPSVSPSPDPCRSENLRTSIKPLDDLMRQFDDYATLAGNIGHSQLDQVIPPMQAIQRAAKDLTIPTCLAALKQSALVYMDVTLQTLTAFQAPSPDVKQLGNGITIARYYHERYDLELARLLGIRIITATPATPGPVGTPEATTHP